MALIYQSHTQYTSDDEWQEEIPKHLLHRSVKLKSQTILLSLPFGKEDNRHKTYNKQRNGNDYQTPHLVHVQPVIL